VISSFLCHCDGLLLKSILYKMDQQKRTLKPPIKISILEKQESEVSYCWKACQLFSYILVVISGIATSLAIGSLLRAFQNECILYSQYQVDSVDIDNKTISVKSLGSLGTAMSYCNFCQFCPVASVIFAGIWGTLFVMCGKGGNASQNLPQPWRIVPPAFLFNLVFVVLSCVSVALTIGGFSSFCDSIVRSVNVTDCEALTDYKWREYPNATNFYDDIVIAETGAAITLVGWLLGFVVLIIRCLSHADFHVVAKLVDSSPTQSETNSTVTTTAATTIPMTPPDKSPNEQEPLIILTPGSGPGSNHFKKSKKKGQHS